MEKYKSLELEILLFPEQDVITTSFKNDDGTEDFFE